MNKIKRGEIYIVNFEDTPIPINNKHLFPAIIVQNDVGNFYSPTTIVVPIYPRIIEHHFQHTVEIIPDCENNLECDSVVILDGIEVIDKSRIVGDRFGIIRDMSKYSICLRKMLTED